MTETLAHSSESTQLSNEYQHDRGLMVFKNLCIPVIYTKVASALKGLNDWKSLFRIKIMGFVEKLPIILK